VIAWFDGLKPEQVCLSAVTLGELQEGIARARNQNPSKATEIERWVDQLEGLHFVIPMDGSCFREAARLMRAKQEDLYDDAMIAATARLHGLTIATRNERDFQYLDVKIVNPFKS
jgi:toxin FitB